MEWSGKESSITWTTQLQSIYRSGSSSPAIPWELLSFSVTTPELEPAASRPHSSVMVCVVLSSSALLRDGLTEGEIRMKLQLKGVYRPESQNTNHRTCQGFSGKLWRLPLFCYCSQLLQNLPPLPRSLIACLPSLQLFFSAYIFPSRNSVFLLFLLLLLRHLFIFLSFSIDLTSRGCANRSIEAILITWRQSTVDQHSSNVTLSVWLFPCFFWLVLSLWSVPLFFEVAIKRPRELPSQSKEIKSIRHSASVGKMCRMKGNGM